MLQRSQLIVVNFLIRYLTNLLKASCISAGLGFFLFGFLLFLLMFSTRQDGSLPDNSLADLFVKFLVTMADPSGQGNFEGGPVELGAAIYLFLLPYLSIASIIFTVLREITQKDLLARITPSLSDALRGGLILFLSFGFISLFLPLPIPGIARIFLFLVLYLLVAVNWVLLAGIHQIGHNLQVACSRRQAQGKSIDLFSWAIASIGLVILLQSLAPLLPTL